MLFGENLLRVGFGEFGMIVLKVCELVLVEYGLCGWVMVVGILGLCRLVWWVVVCVMCFGIVVVYVDY